MYQKQTDNITEAILVLMRDSFGPEWEQKTVDMATDGAAVMTEKHRGVVTNLKRYLKEPNLVGVHCSAHRIELANKQACSKAHMFSKTDNMLLSLYYFYHRSPLNRANLKLSF